jgi:hypothetical protein
MLANQSVLRLRENTELTVAGVRGTEFSVDVDAESTVIRVFEGRILAANANGSLMLGDGQSAVATAGTPPTLRVEARLRDAVRWAPYYDPVIYPSTAGLAGDTDWQRKLARSTEAYRAGNISEAFAAIADLSQESVNAPRFFAYRASLSLAVGRIDQAQLDIDHARARHC